MKAHEENKIYALLSCLNFTEDEVDKIVDYIDDKNMDDDDLINLLTNLEIMEDWIMDFLFGVIVFIGLAAGVLKKLTK